jgi:hypothetical protein
MFNRISTAPNLRPIEAEILFLRNEKKDLPLPAGRLQRIAGPMFNNEPMPTFKKKRATFQLHVYKNLYVPLFLCGKKITH